VLILNEIFPLYTLHILSNIRDICFDCPTATFDHFVQLHTK